jgi:hypothetical protein
MTCTFRKGLLQCDPSLLFIGCCVSLRLEITLIARKPQLLRKILSVVSGAGRAAQKALPRYIAIVYLPNHPYTLIRLEAYYFRHYVNASVSVGVGKYYHR